MGNTENFKKKENLNEQVPQWVTESIKAWLISLRNETDLVNKVSEDLDAVGARSFYYTLNWDNVEYNIDNVKAYLNVIKNKEWSDLRNLSWAWILAVQIALESLWYEIGKIDGRFWSGTQSGVLWFQQQCNLNLKDGLPGKETITKLCEALDSPDSFAAKQDFKPAAVKSSASGWGNGGSSTERAVAADWSSSATATNEQPWSVVSDSWSVDKGYQGDLVLEEEKQAIVQEIKAMFGDVLKDPKWDEVWLTSTGKLTLPSIAIPNTNLEQSIDLAKCLDKNAKLDKDRAKREVEDGIKKLVNKKKAQIWRYLLKQDFCGKYYIWAKLLKLDDESLNDLTTLEKWRIRRYFNKFDHYGIELDGRDTTYDWDKIKIELDDDNWNESYNKWRNNDELIIDAARIVKDDYSLDKNEFYRIMRGVIINIVRKESFK